MTLQGTRAFFSKSRTSSDDLSPTQALTTGSMRWAALNRSMSVRNLGSSAMSSRPMALINLFHILFVAVATTTQLSFALKHPLKE